MVNFQKKKTLVKRRFSLFVRRPFNLQDPRLQPAQPIGTSGPGISLLLDVKNSKISIFLILRPTTNSGLTSWKPSRMFF